MQGTLNEKPELYPGLRLLYLQGWCGVRMRDIGTSGRVPGFAEQNQANQIVELSGFCSDHNFLAEKKVTHHFPSPRLCLPVVPTSTWDHGKKSERGM